MDARPSKRLPDQARPRVQPALGIGRYIVKHDGEKIWGVYMWHDHFIDAYVNGHRILTLAFVDTKTPSISASDASGAHTQGKCSTINAPDGPIHHQ